MDKQSLSSRKLEDKIDELLTRGVDKIYPTKDALEKVLRSGKKLKLYQGFDPTGTKLHIGHMVGIRKLAQFQKLGHHVVFLVGDGTGQAGDPSGKTKSRDTFLTREELRKNATDYVKQASKIVSFEGDNPVKILFNGDWLNKLRLVDILEIAGHFSWQQLAERDLFVERIKKGETLNLREALYPLLQAYDSVAMDVDLEIGGSDQTFNMLCGRSLMKSMKSKDKFVLTTPLLADSSGRKIGKTEGNAIALTDAPNDLFGKVMSFPDEVIAQCFECLTEVPMEEIAKMKNSDNPMANKKRLAFVLVKQLNDEKSAIDAQEYFEKTVQKQETPQDVPLFPRPLNSGTTITDALVETGISSSRAGARRLITQGGTAVANEIITDPDYELPVGENIVRGGKRKFVKLVVSS